MRTKNIFTLGFFLTIVPVFWVIISFFRRPFCDMMGKVGKKDSPDWRGSLEI